MATAIARSVHTPILPVVLFFGFLLSISTFLGVVFEWKRCACTRPSTNESFSHRSKSMRETSEQQQPFLCVFLLDFNNHLPARPGRAMLRTYVKQPILVCHSIYGFIIHTIRENNTKKLLQLVSVKLVSIGAGMKFPLISAYF